jgi:2-amino-4-hydroxy-6-hydroxymethyldihydropteridine diphosphokinase
MFPILNIGPLAIQAAGFILILSLFIGLWLTGIFSKNLGTNEDAIENSILIGLISGLLGARLGFLLQNPSIFSENPLSFFSLTPSMLNTSFGLFVGLITAIIYAQKNHLPMWPTLDTLSPLSILIFAGIHLANLANGENFGLPTNLPWGIDLWNETRHPVQAYAFLLSILTLAGLSIYTKLFRKTGFFRSGILFSLTMMALGLITIITRAFVANKVLLGSFDLWQILGLLFVFLMSLIIYNKNYREQKHITVFLSLGSNQNPIKNLSGGIKNIQKEFKLRQLSSLYITQDVKSGKGSQKFYNQVAEIDTNIPYSDLRLKLKAIEKDFGREPGNKNVVPLDLDILTFDGDVFDYEGKQIPDPNLIKYSYVAVPLAEIAPDFSHPANGKSIKKILANLNDKDKIQKMNEVENGLKE